MNEHETGQRNGPAEGEQEVGRLIRGAGPRAELPQDDLIRITVAARAAWRDTVRSGRESRMRMRGIYALAASLVLALLVGWWWLAGGGGQPAVELATVEFRSGQVEAAGAGNPFGVEVGDRLTSGAVVTTDGGDSGEPALVALRMEGGQSIRLGAGTSLRLHSASRLELDRGVVYVDSGPTVSAGADFEILTALGVVREIGTQYEIRHTRRDQIVRVRVREGSVSVLLNDKSHGAERGEELTLRADGTVDRGVIEPTGPEWDWVQAAAPAMEIEGRSLDSFLEWVSRETALEVRYADTELERSAGTIRLHGSIEGLRPDESIGMILEGSGLDHRIDDGALEVFRP